MADAGCGFAVIVGHVYPVWFGFRGGKGAATVVGVVAAIDLRLLVPLLVSWLLVLVLTGYVGLATMLSGWRSSPRSMCWSRAMFRCSASAWR
jgi:glycerol-3-phosphate acyltransferase PlsY